MRTAFNFVQIRKCTYVLLLWSRLSLGRNLNAIRRSNKYIQDQRITILDLLCTTNFFSATKTLNLATVNLIRLQLRFSEILIFTLLCIWNRFFCIKTTFFFVPLTIFFLAPICLYREFCRLRQQNMPYAFSLKTPSLNLRAKMPKSRISRVHCSPHVTS